MKNYFPIKPSLLCSEYIGFTYAWAVDQNHVVLNYSRSAMGTRSVLVTGFEPFGEHEDNVSKDVAEIIQSLPNSEIIAPQLPRCDLDGSSISQTTTSTIIEWDCRILSVDEKGSKMISSEISQDNSHKWDAIIHMGLCEKCDEPRLETRAKNILDFLMPDNSGRKVNNQRILSSGPESWSTTAPIKRIPFDEFETKFSLSNDAGEFLCNEVYARTLNAVSCYGTSDQLGRKTPVVFLHLPPKEKLNLDKQVELVVKLAAWMVNRPVITVAAGVMRNADDLILSCRRSPEEVFAGEWEFPGGKVEIGESIPDCLIRELEEELCVKVTPLRSLCVHRVVSGDIELELHTWEVSWDSGEISLSVHDKQRWLNIAELEKADWIEADIPMISIVAKKLASPSM